MKANKVQQNVLTHLLVTFSL